MKKLRRFTKINICALCFLLASLDAYAAAINFSGQLEVIEIDNGGGVYSGTPIGTRFTGVIDDVTASGNISDGTTLTSFGYNIAAGGLDVSNNYPINADDAALLNALVESSMFRAGDRIDGVNIEGDAPTSGGGRIEIGLSYIFDASTFSDDSLDNYPFDPEDVLVSLFFIVEEDATEEDVYYAAGQLDDAPPTFNGTGIQITGTSSNMTMNVMAGDTVEFTVNAIEMDNGPLEYRFFVRAGYGEPEWGGNRWTIVQPYGSNNTVMHTFDTPGIYFLAGHVIHPGDTWVFGYPQSGIVVEVWPVQ